MLPIRKQHPGRVESDEDQVHDETGVWLCLGFKTLVDLIPIASRPQVAVIVLTLMTQRGVWELAKQNGAYACLAKQFTTGNDLDKAIQRAVAFVAQMPKEDRYRPI